MSVLDHPLAVPIAAGAAIFSNAFAFGYALGRRRAERETLAVFTPFEDEEEEESPQLTFDFSELTATKERHPSNVIPSMEHVVKDELKIPKKVFERTMEEIKPKPHNVVHTNVFEMADDGWDYAVEVANRDDDHPYIIHVDEFVGNEEDLDQLTITYFEGDDIMVDDKEVPIYDHARLVGELKFGHGSGDPNVVYVRNVPHAVEYEIIRHTGHYSVEVLNLSPESSGG